MKRKIILATICAMLFATMSVGTVFAEETKSVKFEAPYADGIDLIESNPNARLAIRDYLSTEFSTGVYLQGAPFSMDVNGRAEFANANQSCIDTTVKADLSYQVLDYYTNKVYSGVQKTGNRNGMAFAVSSKVQAYKSVSIYIHNNNGTKAAVSGTFGW